MAEVCKRHVARLVERGRSGRHIEEIQRVVDQVAAAGIVDLAARDVAQRAAAWLDGLAVSPLTRSRMRRHLVALGKTAVRWWPPEVLPREPFLALGGEGAPLPVPDFFSIEEARRLVSDEALMLEPTGGTLWAFLLYTGCRLREGTWARWDRIDLVRRTFVVVPPTEAERAAGAAVKRDKSRTVELPPELVAILEERPREHGDFLFGDWWRATTHAPLAVRFHAHLRALGLVPEGQRRHQAHIHSLRHTHASLGLAAGVDSLRLRLSMGHAGPEMAAHYASQALRWRGQLAGWNGELRLRA